MTWHLIGPSNLITRYFGIKIVRFESQEYTFSNKIIYFTQVFPVSPQITLNSRTRNVSGISGNSRRASGNEVSHVSLTYTDPMEHMERELDLLARITGISFEETQSSLVDEDEDSVRKRHIQKGYCSQVPFKLKYTVKFSKDQADRIDVHTYQISDIYLRVGGQLANQEMEPILQGKSLTLEVVFKALYRYSKHYQRRQDFFEKLVEKYPGCIKKNTENSIKVSQLSANRFCGIFTWDIVADKKGKFDSSVSLEVSCDDSEDILPETQEFLERSPEMFDKMKEIIGETKAVYVIVDILTNKHTATSDEDLL